MVTVVMSSSSLARRNLVNIPLLEYIVMLTISVPIAIMPSNITGITSLDNQVLIIRKCFNPHTRAEIFVINFLAKVTDALVSMSLMLLYYSH